MISTGIRELRQHASCYVRMAKAGRRVAPPPVPHGKRPLSEVVQELREQERG